MTLLSAVEPGRAGPANSSCHQSLVWVLNLLGSHPGKKLRSTKANQIRRLLNLMLASLSPDVWPEQNLLRSTSTPDAQLHLHEPQGALPSLF